MEPATPCTLKPVIAAKLTPVTVNGVEIARAAISREAQNHPAPKPVDAWLAAARALTVRELLLQEARRIGLTPKPLTDEEGRRERDQEALVRQLIETEVHMPEPDDEVCRRYYDRNRSRFRSADLFEVSHILMAAPPRDRTAREAARCQAEAIIATLAEKPGQFAELAKIHSSCPSRDIGGNLGQIGPGQTVAEFEQALTTMPVGGVHRMPVETRFGFHVVRVDRHEAGRSLPFDLVRERIAGYLSERVHRTAIRQYISVLAGRATLTGIVLSGAESPLVQ